MIWYGLLVGTGHPRSLWWSFSEWNCSTLSQALFSTKQQLTELSAYTSKFIIIALAHNLTLHPLWNIVTAPKINMIAAKKLMLKVQVHGRYKPCLRSAKARQMFPYSFHGGVSGVFFTLLKWSHTDFPFNYYLNIAGSSCLNDSVCLWFTKWLSPHCVKILFPFLWQTERSKLAWQRNTE